MLAAIAFVEAEPVIAVVAGADDEPDGAAEEPLGVVPVVPVVFVAAVVALAAVWKAANVLPVDGALIANTMPA